MARAVRARVGWEGVRLKGEWLPRRGQRAKDGITYEVYRNMSARPRMELRTELYVPLA